MSSQENEEGKRKLSSVSSIKPSNPIQLVTGDKASNSNISDENTSTVVSNRCISRYYIRLREIKLEEIKQILSTNQHSPTQAEVVAELKKRDTLKKDLKLWCRNRIRQIQFEEAIKQGLDVLTWEDIGDQWQSDGSPENQQRMFQIMHGVFERCGKWNGVDTWAIELEREFMQQYGLQYDKPDSERQLKRKRVPAGIEEIIKNQKPALNKLINLRTMTKGSHGKKIVVVGKVSKCNDVPDGYVRKKGIFYPEFIRYHPKFSKGKNEEVINSKEAKSNNTADAMMKKISHG